MLYYSAQVHFTELVGSHLKLSEIDVKRSSSYSLLVLGCSHI